MNWEEIVRTAKTTPGELAKAVIEFDMAIKDGAKLPASWRPHAPHLAGYENQARRTNVHEESRDGGRTWMTVSTPAHGIDLVDGVMVRKAVR